MRILMAYSTALMPMAVLAVAVSAQNFSHRNLPDGAIIRLGGGHFTDVVYSPDGSLLAMGRDTGISVYEVATGKEIAFLTDPDKPTELRSVLFSPDGKTLACIGGGPSYNGTSILLWDVDTWEFINSFGHEWGIGAIVFSRDSKKIIGDNRKWIRRWDIESGTLEFSEELEDRRSTPIILSSDGNVMARSNMDTVQIRDPNNGLLLYAIEVIESNFDLVSLTFSPDGSILAVVGAGHLFLLDVDTWEVRHKLGSEKWQYNIESIDFSSDSKIVAGVSGKQTSLWNTETGRLEKEFNVNRSFFPSWVELSNDGNALAISSRTEFEIWDWKNEELLFTIPGRFLAFSPDSNTFVSVNRDISSVELRNIDGSLMSTFLFSAWIHNLTFTPNDDVLAMEVDNGMLLWDSSDNIVTKIDHPEFGPYDMKLTPDGETIITAHKEQIFFWDYKGNLLESIDIGHEFPDSFELSSDGRFLASGSECLDFNEPREGCENLYIYEVHERTLAYVFEGDEFRGVRSLGFSPDGTLLASTRQVVGCNLWDTSNWTLENTIDGDILGFSPDGSIIVTQYSRDAWLWDTSTGDNIARLDGHRPEELSYTPDVTIARFSYDGEILACATGYVVLLWDMSSLSLTDTLQSYDHVTGIAASPNRKILATNSYDNKIQLWSMSGDSITTLEGHSNRVGSLTFSPDGDILASTSEDGIVLLWDIPYLIQFHYPTAIRATENLRPTQTVLLPNYPNPFNYSTKIAYRLADPGKVELAIYNVLGQLIRTLVEQSQSPGHYNVLWDGRDQEGALVGAGVYMTRLRHSDGIQTQRLLFLK